MNAKQRGDFSSTVGVLLRLSSSQEQKNSGKRSECSSYSLVSLGKPA